MVAAADLITAAGEAAFAIARARTGRSAFKLFREAERTKDDMTELTAKEKFQTLPLLLDENLLKLAKQVLTEARGSLVSGETRFPSTIWVGGATDVVDGYSFQGTILDFVELLTDRAQTVAPKREGMVVEPTTTTDGRRTNESTTAVHALFLDVDGTGSWDALLKELEYLDYCFITYQSGGWSPTTPKWRVVLPLSQPFNTSTEAKQSAWKAFYHHARVVFGSTARLLSIGFDSATDTPCCPWFLTEKRSPNDPPRQVLWRPGHSLDAMALALALPTIEDTPALTDEGARQAVTPAALNNERLNEIVEALTTVTSRISSNRRDLYLALPGVLLDRGVEPDDVRAIIETVSSRYPRSHPDKHADNLHCAKTTINKWERDDRVTRIGTLNNVAREVARTVDLILPDPDKVEFIALARKFARRQTNIPPPPDIDDADVPLWQTPVDLKILRSFAVKMRRKKAKVIGNANQVATRGMPEPDVSKDAVHWILLDRLLKKKTLASPIDGDAETKLDREDALYKLVGLLAFRFPKNTPIETVVELLRPSVFLTLQPGELADKWLKLASRWYELSLATRLEMDTKKEIERKANLELSLTYIARGRAL